MRRPSPRAALFAEKPELKARMAEALADLTAPDPRSDEPARAAAFRRQVALYEGQIEASYGRLSQMPGGM